MKQIKDKNIYIIYTGGTIGMDKQADGYAPTPGLLEDRLSKISEIVSSRDVPNYIVKSYDPLIDSSNMDIDTINRIGRDIYENYDKYDGFIVLHGTDTMSYTATALSFMFAGLNKPIILTGAQESVVGIRSDSIGNLLNSLYFAAHFPLIHEVCICFGGKLFRGNRSFKFSTRSYNAFSTPNHPALCEMSDKPICNRSFFTNQEKDSKISFCELTNKHKIDVLYLFPGFSQEMLQKKLELVDSLVIATYGLGNAPTNKSFLKTISDAAKSGKILTHCSQCPHNLAQPSIYEAGVKLEKAGSINLYDMTIASSIFKIIYLNSGNLSKNEIKQKLQENLRGEITSTEIKSKHWTIK